jgi:DNA topoisomerase-1
VVKRCQELPGEELFQYHDDEGLPRPVTSQDVNAYLRELSGEDFTAKDFRTWGGTVIAVRELAALGAHQSRTEAERNVIQAVDLAAKHLNNTRAVARRSYIHPEVIDSYLEGELPELWPRLLSQAKDVDCLSREESALLNLLELRARSGSHAGGEGMLEK